jgi:hypothetical protein
MISSLDGNDVFAMSRIYEQKYRDELKDYVEATPPLLLNIAGVTVETGSSSFKEFMILFDKIYQGSNSIVAKKQLDPNAKMSPEAREMELKAYKDGLDFKQIKSANMSVTSTINPLLDFLEAEEKEIKVEDDYLLRKGMFNIVDTKFGEWISFLDAEKKVTSKERLGHINSIKGIKENWLKNRDIITKFEKDSPQTQSGIYDINMKLNVNINDALVRIDLNFVPWSKIIRSNEINYNIDDTETKIDVIIKNLNDNIDNGIELTSTVHDNMIKLGKQMKKLPSSSSETVRPTVMKNEIIHDPSSIRYNKADYNFEVKPPQVRQPRVRPPSVPTPPPSPPPTLPDLTAGLPSLSSPPPPLSLDDFIQRWNPGK